MCLWKLEKKYIGLKYYPKNQKLRNKHLLLSSPKISNFVTTLKMLNYISKFHDEFLLSYFLITTKYSVYPLLRINFLV